MVAWFTVQMVPAEPEPAAAEQSEETPVQSEEASAQPEEAKEAMETEPAVNGEPAEQSAIEVQGEKFEVGDDATTGGDKEDSECSFLVLVIVHC